MAKKDLKNFYIESWTDEVVFGIKFKKHLHSEKSKFQQLDVYETKEFGNVLTLDGLMMVNEKDEFMYHEMITHPAFAVNPNIKKVLIIGGGDGGTAREVAKYKSVTQIDLVEIDRRVNDLTKKYIPSIFPKSLINDKRFTEYYEDGVDFVKRTKNGTYDLVLIDSTDPFSIGEGLFTTEFYKDVKRVLSKKGIVVNQHENTYFDYYKNNAIKSHTKLSKVFKVTQKYWYQIPVYPSGLWLFGFSSDTFKPQITEAQAKAWDKLKINTKYYESTLHNAVFHLPKYIKQNFKETLK